MKVRVEFTSKDGSVTAAVVYEERGEWPTEAQVRRNAMQALRETLEVDDFEAKIVPVKSFVESLSAGRE